MRLKQFCITSMVLSVALCAIAVERPSSSASSQTQSSLPQAPSYGLTFDQFKSKYGKTYDSLAEEAYRRWIFTQNMQNLNTHNNDPTRSYNMKPNAFMDVTEDEFRSVYTLIYTSDSHSKQMADQLTGKSQCQNGECNQDTLTSNKDLGSQNSANVQSSTGEKSSEVGGQQQGANGQIEKSNTNRNLQELSTTLGLLTSSGTSTVESSTSSASKTSSTVSNPKIVIDWELYAGPIRFQGFCGACYAFSTVDTYSSHLAIYQYGFFYQLSVQQIIDCSDNGLTFGCYGGYLQGALTYMQLEGIVSEASYPFSSGNKGFSGKCLRKDGSFKVKSFTPLTQGSCSEIISRLYDGPISAGISGYKLRFYSEGVFDACGNYDRLDHAVVIVGYRSDKGWRIKNSWGSEWGEDGFGWIAGGNTCGICNMTVAIKI